MSNRSKGLRFTILTLLLFICFAQLCSGYEVEYGKAESQTPLSDWWSEVTGTKGEGIVDGVQYQERWPIPSGETEVPEGRPTVVFTVTPASPILYWKFASADYYTGFEWLTTTESRLVAEFPARAESVEYTFTVEFIGGSGMNPLHVPESKTNLSEFGFSPSPEEVNFYLDSIADIYSVELGGPEELAVTYQATFHPPPTPGELRNVTWASVHGAPVQIRELYLQLPDTLPFGVRAIADDLLDPSLSVFDQILADVSYLRTGFTYGPLEESAERDVVWTYLQARQGHCMHANSALVVILRCQGIPARVSFGFYPMREVDDKLLFMPPGHCQAEAYLPPHGWIYFNATPEKPPGFGGPEPLPTDYPAHTTPGSTGKIPGEKQPQPRLPTVLEFICPENSRREEPVGFSVRLTSGGTPLPGKEIKIVDGWAGAELTTLQTTSGWKGGAFEFSRTTIPGERYLLARFDGDGTYAPSEKTRPFLLYAETSLTLELGSGSVQVGSNLSFWGSLEDDFGAGVAGQEISVLIDGQSLGTVWTDARGKYENSVLVGSDLALGTHGIQTRFEPERKGYLPSESSNHSFVVEAAGEGVKPPDRTQLAENAEGRAGREVRAALPLLEILSSAGIAALFLALAFFRRGKPEVKGAPRFPTSKSLLQMLTDFGSAKKYREGLIAAYYQFVGMLLGTNLYQVQPSQTARELASELSAKLKDFPSDRFNSFVDVYEKAMFSARPITEGEYKRAVEDFCFTVDHVKWGGG